MGFESFEELMDYAGGVLAEADLESVIHFFVYNADEMAGYFLEECPVG